MGTGRDRSGPTRVMGMLIAIVVVGAACGGGDGDEGTSQGTIQGETIVVDQEELAAARAELDAAAEGDEPQIASAAETDVDALADDAEATDGENDDDIEVAEADEDELDGLPNAVTTFTQCLDDEGFEFEGVPGQDGATAADFDQAYLQALGACAAESDIVASLEAFGEAQANLTPEEIAQTNFGLPIFKECLEDLGWTVGDLVPDERGALGFDGGVGGGLQPPDGTDDLDFDDVGQCRQEAETHVAENYQPEDADG